jgi:hypothetical protein
MEEKTLLDSMMESSDLDWMIVAEDDTQLGFANCRQGPTLQDDSCIAAGSIAQTCAGQLFHSQKKEQSNSKQDRHRLVASENGDNHPNATSGNFLSMHLLSSWAPLDKRGSSSLRDRPIGAQWMPRDA